MNRWFITLFVFALFYWISLDSLRANEPMNNHPTADSLWQNLAPLFETPEAFTNDFGKWQSPLLLANGERIQSPAAWRVRRAEIEADWRAMLGPTPPLLEKPRMKVLASVEREGYTEHHVHLEIAPEDRYTDAYLLIPPGEGPFPAVLVTFYEPRSSAGLTEAARGKHDYGAQLARRGFVTLSIGTPGMIEEPEENVRILLPREGKRYGCQPLAFLAYVAANANTALRQHPLVDEDHIGVVGLSYGGKWAMFASCLDERFACAVWSDPGIVWNEANGSVNYWEPWYLGYDPQTAREAGLPGEANPRTGMYKKLIESRRDLVELHALMAPRPVLVAGGTEDPPENWRALNHLQQVSQLLADAPRVGMSRRPTHIPTPEALEQTLQFFQYFLRAR